MAQTIALFPLDHVLLPGAALPLHVFEPRYRRLIADVGGRRDRRRGSFGVVLGRAGVLRPSEPVAPSRGALSTPPRAARSQEPELAGIGTLAEIIENEPYPDGRCDLLTAGTQRFQILEVDAVSQPYLQARVELLDEPIGSGAAAALDRARPLCTRYGEQLAALASRAVIDELPADPVRCSYEIAARLQLTMSDRQALLCALTAEDRLCTEIRLMRRELALLAAIRAVPVPLQMLHVQSGLN